MPALRLRARRRYVPDRSRRVRFARLGLGGCFGMAVTALVAAASQNPERALLVWPTGAAVMAAIDPGPLAAWNTGVPTAGVIETAPMQNARQIFGQVSARMGNGEWTVEIIPAEIEPPPRTPTSASGIEICELLPLTAKWMHQAAVVRSLNHKAGCHNTLPPFTGYRIHHV